MIKQKETLNKYPLYLDIFPLTSSLFGDKIDFNSLSLAAAFICGFPTEQTK